MTRSISEHDPGSRVRHFRSARGHAIAAPLLWGVVILALLVSACSSSASTHGDLARDKEILASCPKDARVAGKVDLDVSGSTRTSELGGERTKVVETVARRTAICGGHLRVTAFSATSTATAVLYDDDLVLPGATDNARLRRVQKIVDEVMAKVANAYQAGIQKLSPGGSDIVGQYRLAAEYLAQLGQGYRLELVIVTDGIHTADLRVGSSSLTPARAKVLAAKVTMPKLPDASVTVAGLGKIASGKPVSSAVANGLVTFYDALCARTGADRCLSVTDYAVEGR